MAKGKVIDLEPARATTAIDGCRVGWLVEWSTEDGPVIDYPGNHLGPVTARSTVSLAADTVADAIRSRRGLLLMFERGRPDLPVVVGLLQESDRVDTTPEPVDVRVDGKRVELEAAHEIVLRCGEASITLRANGRIAIRGVYVETQATGTNRIKGGSVQIN